MLHNHHLLLSKRAAGIGSSSLESRILLPSLGQEASYLQRQKKVTWLIQLLAGQVAIFGASPLWEPDVFLAEPPLQQNLTVH